MDALEQQLETFSNRQPRLGQGVYLAPGAAVVGDVTLGDCCSVWYNAVLRGDINKIVVGRGTNIQDTAVLHLADESPCVLGDHVTVGHGAIVHACTVGNEVLIGMRAIVLDGAVVGDHCLIGAGALVPQGMKIPDGSLVLGAPGRVVRALTEEERVNIRNIAEKYIQLAAYCLKQAGDVPK